MKPVTSTSTADKIEAEEIEKTNYDFETHAVKEDTDSFAAKINDFCEASNGVSCNFKYHKENNAIIAER